MKKAAVIYWSGTGNTEAMANAVLEGMKSAGADAVLLTASDVDGSAVGAYDAVALGCPAMGSEVLEDMEFEPERQTCRPVRLLRLGRRRVDAQLGARLPQLRYPARVRQRDLQRSAR